MPDTHPALRIQAASRKGEPDQVGSTSLLTGEKRPMGLVACRECGADVSESAPTCPNCGVENPGGNAPRVTTGIGALFLILLAVLILILLGQGFFDTIAF
jgi:ribosomal protein L40E